MLAFIVRLYARYDKLVPNNLYLIHRKQTTVVDGKPTLRLQDSCDSEQANGTTLTVDVVNELHSALQSAPSERRIRHSYVLASLAR